MLSDGWVRKVASLHQEHSRMERGDEILIVKYAHVKDEHQSKMLPESYQNQLKSQLEPRTYLLLGLLINLIQAFKTVRVEKLATALPLPILFESRRRKIQRFLKQPQLNLDKLWLPLLKIWLDAELEPNKIYYLAIDRTSWGQINLLTIGIVWNNRAIPIYVIKLNKLGNSNLREQQEIIARIMPLFTAYKICILGDREFCGVGLANWLRHKKIYFALRLKRSNYIENSDQISQQLSQLGLQPGVSLFLDGVQVTKNTGFAPFNLAAKWSKSIKGKQPKEGWFILTSFTELEPAISAYKQRFSIEEMFRDFKTGGYNLEDIQVNDCRFIPLITLIFIAYLSATLCGETIKHQGYQKYLGRVNESHRSERRHSSFYLGCHGVDWLDRRDLLEELVRCLMILSPNKHRYYRRGERAMMLVTARL